MVLGTWYKPEEPGPAEGKNKCAENRMDRPQTQTISRVAAERVWRLAGRENMSGKLSFWKAGLLREAVAKERSLEGTQRKELSGMFCSGCLSWNYSQSSITP